MSAQDIGHALRAIRVHQGLTRRALDKKLVQLGATRIPSNFVWQAERGRSLSAHEHRLYCLALGVTDNVERLLRILRENAPTNRDGDMRALIRALGAYQTTQLKTA